MSDRGLNSAGTSRPSVRHAVALGLVLLSVTVAGAALGGVTAAESQSSPVEISNWTDLDDIRNNPGANYMLVNDLDETTPGYDMVAGPNANGARGFDPIDGFSGGFDGQGNSIANLTIDRPIEDQGGVGLFGSTSGGAVIEEVTLTSATVTGYRDVGGLVGENRGTVINSSASGDLNGTSGSVRVGGLVGRNNGTVSNSSASGAVDGLTSVGGLVGTNSGTVSNSSASGNMGDGSQVGGLVGSNSGNVSTSSASGDVSTDSLDVGGLVGINDGTVSNSSASGDVSTGSNRVGGLVGINSLIGTVSNSSASGAVNGSNQVGGLVGVNSGTVNESFATGAVTGSTDVGGLVGQLGSGLLVPRVEAILRDSYYDTQTTEQQAAVGTIVEGNGTAELRGEVAGLPTSQMQGASAAQNMGALDFTSTWQTVTAPAGYPELQSGPPPAAERGPDIEGTDSDGDGGDGFGPGFGPGVVLAGLSGAGYLLKRRGTTTDTDAE